MTELSSTYKLILPGKGDEDAYRGDQNLLDKHGLSKIANVVLSATSKIGDYSNDAMNVKKQLYKGPGMTLEPLADLYPSRTKPDFAPIPSSTPISLEQGVASLPASDFGTPINTIELAGGGPKIQSSTAEKKPLPTKIKLKLGGASLAFKGTKS